jgi:hypothetical protein
MTTIELIADGCARNLEMLKMLLADFSDADMIVRPCPGANHALWQLGHLIGSETFMVSACGGKAAELPAGFGDKFKKETAKIDDPKAFGTKADLLALFDKVRAATVNWIKTLKEADLNKPAPEAMRAFFPTVGHLVLLLPGHLDMHAGQVQVLRRKLGKPILF